MAYLKLVFDELEIAHLSEDGQYLCANKGVPQYRTDYLDFVCTDQEGKLLRPNFVTEHFEWLLRQYGLPHIRFHDLRHSCASLMVMNGVSMKQVQEWLGHSTFSTTADIYAHLDYKSKEGSAGVIAGLLETKK